VTDELEGRGRKRSWLNLRLLSRHPGGIEQNNGNLGQDSRSPGRELNPGHHALSRIANHSTTTFGLV
jgi:hypothetical protein